MGRTMERHTVALLACAEKFFRDWNLCALQRRWRWSARRLGVQPRWMGDDRFQLGHRLAQLPEVGPGPAELGDAAENLFHGVSRTQHLAVAAEAADHLQAE